MKYLTLVAALYLAGTANAQGLRAPPKVGKTRVLVIDTGKKSAIAAGLEKLGFEVRTAQPGPSLGKASLDWMDAALVIDAGALAKAKIVEELNTAVSAGAGLAVFGRAARARPGTAAVNELLGRGSMKDVPPKAAVELAVAVLDQNHPVTQSVTHFIQSGVSPVLPTRRGGRARVLASAMLADPEALAYDALVPVLWVTRLGRGQTVVCQLDIRTGPSADLVFRLAARSAEWTGSWKRRRAQGRPYDRYIRVGLPDGKKPMWKLAAEALGPKDTGLVPGRAAAKGFYRGREVSQTMSFHGARWLIRPEREKEELPDKVVSSLAVRPGQTIADVGAGNGYYALRFAKQVGPKGKVYAVDIQKEMLALLAKRIEKTDLRNIVPVLCTETDPKLPADSIDLAIMVDVYHEISKPTPVIAAVHKSLRKDGRLVLVEYRGEDPTVLIKPRHRMTVKQAKAELEAVGFKLLEVKKFLPIQHVLVFGKVAEK